MPSNDLKIKIAHSEAEKKACFALRQKIYVKEQNIKPEEEFDEFDKKAETIHLLALIKNDPVGVMRLLPTSEGMKFERMAVLKKYRGQGIPKALLVFCFELCRQKGIKKAYLNAQTYVQKLYAAFGFKPVGEVFDEVGIDHIKMKKNL